MNCLKISKKIIPNKLIINNECRSIRVTNSYFWINEFEIFLNEENYIIKIVINDGHHPNCDPKTNEFCIPDNLKKIQYFNLGDKRLKPIDLIISMLEVYNFNSSFYQPWYAFEYEERFI